MSKRALVAVYSGGLAGRGTRALILQSYGGLERLARRLNAKLITAWQAGDSLPKPTIDFTLTSPTTEEKHYEARRFADMLMAKLSKRGLMDPVVYCFGYTSFLPYGFQPYIKEGRVTFVWGDCSPPDTDELGCDMTSRFFGTAYEGTHGILYGWHDALPKTRIPPGIASYRLTMLPLSEDNMETLRKNRTFPRILRLPEWEKCDKRLILASSDIWSPSVRTWMTPAQHEGAIADTRTIFTELERIGMRSGETMGLVIDPRGLQLMGNDEFKFLNLIPVELPPGEYRNLLPAADLVFTRASHSVTSAECAAMGVPQMVVPMPAHGYMNVEDFTADIRQRRLALVPQYNTWDTRPDIATAYERFLCREDADMSANAMAEFDRVDTDKNFFSCLEEFLS